MKRIVYLISLILTTLTATGQSSRIQSVSLSYSPLNFTMISQETAPGSPAYQIDNSSFISLGYLTKINNLLWLETGVDYAHYSVKTSPNLPPEADDTPHYNNMSAIQIPLMLRTGFSEYFYLYGGAHLTLEMFNNSPLNNLSGIGLQAGLGVQYPFRNGLSLFLNPELKLNSLIPFSFSYDNKLQLEGGVKIGAAYKF